MMSLPASASSAHGVDVEHGHHGALLDAISGLQARLSVMEVRLGILEASNEARKQLLLPVQPPELPPEDCTSVDLQLPTLEKGGVDDLEEAETTTSASPVEKVRTGAEEPERVDYLLGTTLWDAPAIMGLPGMEGYQLNTILLLNTMLNAAAQLYLSWVLTHSDSFILQDKWQQLRLSARRWRDNEAHQYSQVDASGTSLAARVCGLDEALSVAGKQADVLTEINNYAGLEDSKLYSTRFRTGPWLCTVCLFLWIVVICREIRHLATYLVAMLSLPRGPTEFSDGNLLRISHLRVVGIVLVSLLRLTVAIALCYAGVMWLSYTSSTTELILNAAALMFVLDLDELLLETTVPAVVRRFAEELKPVYYKSPIFYIEALAPMCLLFFLVTISVTLLVFPNVEAMIDVKREMCSGLMDFAVSQNGAGFAVALMTKPFQSARRTGGRGIMERSVQDLHMRYPEGTDPLTVWSDYAWITVTQESFHSSQGLQREDFARLDICADKDKLIGGKHKIGRSFWFSAATAMTKGVAEYDPDQWNCADYFPFCDRFALVRSLCPVTCGCDSATSGQIFTKAKAGVPQACLDLVQKPPAANQSCVDMEVASTTNWTRWWRAYQHTVSTMDPTKKTDPTFEAFVQRKIALGCADTSPDPFQGHGFCDGSDPHFQASMIGTIRPFCTATCCRGDLAKHPDCPASCRG